MLRRVVGLLVLTAWCVTASPAHAAQPSATLAAVADGANRPILHWSLSGSSDQVNVLPHLRCGADASANPLFAPATIPCVWLVDHLAAQATAAPPACVLQAERYASARCDMRAYSGLVIDAAQRSGDRTVMMFNPKAEGGSGICAWLPIAVRLGAGTGEVRAQDGCVERISCASGYAGTVHVDAIDVVRGCREVRGGSGGGSATTSTGSSRRSDARPGADVEPASCAGARSGKRGQSPLYSVSNRPRGRRGMVVAIQMRRAVPITVEVQMRRSGGTKVVRWISRCALKGRNVYTFPNATGGAQRRQAYRVVVRSPNSSYPLISSWETLPRG